METANSIKNRNMLLVLACILLNQLVIMVTGKAFGTYIIIIFITCLFYIKKIDSIDYLLLALFLPNKYIQVLALIMYAIKQKELYNFNFSKEIIIFFCYSLISGIINCLWYKGSFINLIIEFLLYYFYIVIIKSLSNSNSHLKCEWLLNRLFLLEVIVSFIQLIYFRNIGDCITGTMISAHYLGTFFLAFLYFYQKVYKNNKISKFLPFFILILFELYITDAKHVWICFLLAFFINIVLSKVKVRKKIIVCVFLMLVFILGGIKYFQWTVDNHSPLSTNKFIVDYIYTSPYNNKFVFFRNTINELESINGLTGFGMGQYGSQVCISRAKGIIYSYNHDYHKYNVAIEPYKKSIEGLMTKWYVEHGIEYSSMVLGYPLVSFVPFVAELGIAGLLLFLLVLEQLLGQDTDKTLVFMFFLMSVFDTYFEIPCVFILMIVITILTHKLEKKKMNINKETISPVDECYKYLQKCVLKVREMLSGLNKRKD